MSNCVTATKKPAGEKNTPRGRTLVPASKPGCNGLQCALLDEILNGLHNSNHQRWLLELMQHNWPERVVAA
jgi:hypothetical protein